jgi:Flp pilus assembly protein TadD
MRKWIMIFGLCVATLMAVYGGYRGYRVWKQKHMLALAHEFLAKSDGRNAALSLQEVLRVNPVNLEATRLMAQLAEAARSPSALIWRSRVVALNGKSTPDRLALAQTALVFHDYISASNALEGVDAEGKNTAVYQNLAGALAVDANQMDEAELHFLEAARLEPTNPIPQLNLAVVLLHSSNALAQAQARSSLDHIAGDPDPNAPHCQALRELVTDALSNHQLQTAENWSQKLVMETNSVFEDRLLRLNVLQQAGSAGFKPELASFQREAADDPAKIYELGTWELAHNSAGDALAWLETLPEKTLASPAARLMTAECRTAVRDWPGLQASLGKQNWAELDFIRYAFLTRALRGQGLTASASGEWEQALRAANGQKESLIMLLRLAGQWNFVSETEGILWTIVSQYPEERWAYQTLVKVLAASGQTRSLMQLFSQEVKRSPSDFATKNNLAMLALLLDAQELKPTELAEEVYQKSPTNSAFASTYAFSLYLKKRNAEALAVMQRLDAQQLQNPEISGYYGLILKANGRPAEAKTYLDLAAKAALLPEERKLMDAARTGA